MRNIETLMSSIQGEALFFLSITHIHSNCKKICFRKANEVYAHKAESAKASSICLARDGGVPLSEESLNQQQFGKNRENKEKDSRARLLKMAASDQMRFLLFRLECQMPPWQVLGQCHCHSYQQHPHYPEHYSNGRVTLLGQTVMEEKCQCRSTGSLQGAQSWGLTVAGLSSRGCPDGYTSCLCDYPDPQAPTKKRGFGYLIPRKGALTSSKDKHTHSLTHLRSLATRTASKPCS